MLRFMLIRILQALPVIFVVITATFFLVRSAPGGPFDQEKVVIPEVKKALEAQYRLDLPLHEQYFAYLGDLAQGDLGPSFKYPGRSVNEILFAGLPVTAELGLYALIIALCIGVTAGVFASLRPNTAQDCADEPRYDRHLYAVFLIGAAIGAGIWYLARLATDYGLGRYPRR